MFSLAVLSGFLVGGAVDATSSPTCEGGVCRSRSVTTTRASSVTKQPRHVRGTRLFARKSSCKSGCR